MASRPDDGTEPDESPGEPDDPGRPDVPEQPEPDALPDPEVEERWAEIVSRLGPAYGGVPGGGADGRPDPIATDPRGWVAPEVDEHFEPPDDDPGARAQLVAGSDPRGWTPDEVDEHFEPPDPGPVFGGDPLLTMAWIAVVVPPILLMVSVLAWRDMPSLALRVAGVAFLVGIGVLFWRMPASRDEDDGPGAVV
jgi:hypothetical protein